MPRALSFDPASEITGWAVTEPPAAVRFHAPLIACGKIVAARKAPSNERIRAIALEAEKLILEHGPEFVILEDTTGKVSGRHGGGGAGLAIYGKAIGYLLARCDALAAEHGFRVVTILENEWIKTGMSEKRARIQACAAAYPGLYSAELDPGGDVADAIGLGRYFWFRRWMNDGKTKTIPGADGDGGAACDAKRHTLADAPRGPAAPAGAPPADAVETRDLFGGDAGRRPGALLDPFRA